MLLRMVLLLGQINIREEHELKGSKVTTSFRGVKLSREGSEKINVSQYT